MSLPTASCLRSPRIAWNSGMRTKPAISRATLKGGPLAGYVTAGVLQPASRQTTRQATNHPTGGEPSPTIRSRLHPESATTRSSITTPTVDDAVSGRTLG